MGKCCGRVHAPTGLHSSRQKTEIMDNETYTHENEIAMHVEPTQDVAVPSNGVPPRNLEDTQIQEWLESLDSVLESSGPEVATEILERLRAHATVSGIDLRSEERRVGKECRCRW